VVVAGDVSMEYDDAYSAESHVRSTVVSVGLLGTKLVTASGSGANVLIGFDVVDEPLPFAFEGVIMNVYSVSGVNSMNVMNVSVVVIVPDGGDVSMEYNVAAGDRFHTRSTVVSVGLLAIKPVTGGGNVLENTATPLVMKLITP
jgi:hypothetical protein